MKTVVITGTTSGIGYETAKEILQRGDHLVAINRSKEKMERCMEEWKALYSNAYISAYYADVASMMQIKTVCQSILDNHPRIDILINNAGVYLAQKEMTDMGWEKTFAVNHMAYVAVTKMLLPALKACESARIVNVSSRAHYYGSIDVDTVENPPKYRGQRVYGTSKLCNILYTRALAKRLSGTQITVNCLHPGVVRTGFANNQGGLMGWGFWLLSRFFISPQEGAKTSIFLAYDASMATETGGYYAKCKKESPSTLARNDEIAERLWDKSMVLLSQAWGEQ